MIGFHEKGAGLARRSYNGWIASGAGFAMRLGLPLKRLIAGQVTARFNDTARGKAPVVPAWARQMHGLRTPLPGLPLVRAVAVAGVLRWTFR